MTRQDWIEYFEVVNGRSPLPEELARALANGEFTEEEPILDVQGDPNAFVGEPSPQQGQPFDTSAAGAQAVPNPTPQAGPESVVAPQASQFGANPAMGTPAPQTVDGPAMTGQTSQIVPDPSTVGQAPQGADPAMPSPQAGAQASLGQATPQANPAQPSQQMPAFNQGLTQEPQMASPAPGTGGLQNPQAASQGPVPGVAPATPAANQSAPTFGSPAGQGYQVNPAMAGLAQAPVKKQRKRKWLFLWIILAILAVLGLSAAGYAGWRLHSGNITGMWQLDQTYSASSKSWQKSDELDYTGYLIVNKDKTAQTKGYYKVDSDFVFTADSFVGSIFKVDQWNQEMDVTLSQSSYESKVKRYTENKLDYSSSLAKSTAQGFSDTFADEVAKCDVSYQIKGKTLTVTYTKPNGKVLKKQRYHRLSDSKKTKAEKDLKEAQSKFEKTQKENNNYY